MRTFLTASRSADSHRVAIGLHETGFVSLYISLAKYFFNILFCNHNYLSIIVYTRAPAAAQYSVALATFDGPSHL